MILLLIDGSIGFEMETFEMISMMKQIGFRNCMGVVTHMDFFKDNKQMRNQKKMMKERFRKEVGDDCKLFFLTGIQYGLYMRVEVERLARFIGVIKKKSEDRSSYVLVDRWDEGENQMDFYGYVRGQSYRQG